MSGTLRQRRPLINSLQYCHSCPSWQQTFLAQVQHRTFMGGLFGRNKKKDTASRQQEPFLADLLERKKGGMAKNRQQMQKGDISANSLFTTEDTAIRDAAKLGATKAKDIGEVAGEARNIADMAAVLDPNPRQRQLWQRKQVIKAVRRRERLTKDQFIKKTERELTVKSHNFKTSVKKLGPLARQIQGKTLEDAIVQMRFSKKKVAKEVKEHLEFARDKAIVSRGMGLGGINFVGDEAQKAAEVDPIKIEKKDGSRYTVTDPSKIYVDQAWVGRGPFGTLPDYRARGNVYRIRTPWTHISVKLKEEGTLVRQYQDREAKRDRKRLDNVWVPLPDRGIPGQHQYFTW